MKEKLTSDIRKIFDHCSNWAKLEVEYLKLTTAEKLTIFLSSVALCAVFMLIGIVMLTVLVQCLVDVFKLMMAPWLACLAVVGVLLVLMLLIYLFRNALIINPIAKFVSKLFIKK